MNKEISTKMATHRLTLKDDRVFDLTQSIYDKLYPVYMNKSTEWGIPIDINGSLFTSGDMKYLESWESIQKRERVREESNDFAKIEKILAEELINGRKKTEKEMTEIDKLKRDCKGILYLYSKFPRRFVGIKLQEGLPLDKIKELKKEQKEKQEDLDFSWSKSIKDEAKKYKKEFYNLDYWFLHKNGDWEEGLSIKDKFVVVPRANVENDKDIDINAIQDMFNT